MGYAYVYVGRHAEAIQLLEPCADDGAASSALGMLRWYMLSALAEAHRREGELETARAIATRAVELGHANGALTAEYNAQLVLASTLAATHGEAAGPAIDAALARADSLLAESGAESFRPRWHLTRAECARALGKVETVRRELQAAQGVCERMGMDEFAGEIARELASGGG
jgi:tetratricopeptide (TPR) repeat protein